MVQSQEVATLDKLIWFGYFLSCISIEWLLMWKPRRSIVTFILFCELDLVNSGFSKWKRNEEMIRLKVIDIGGLFNLSNFGSCKNDIYL